MSQLQCKILAGVEIAVGGVESNLELFLLYDGGQCTVLPKPCSAAPLKLIRVQWEWELNEFTGRAQKSSWP